MTQHLNFVRTCELFGVFSLGFAIIYYVFGHYPATQKAKIVEMEEFEENLPKHYNHELQLDSNRSDGGDTQRDKYRTNIKNSMFNDTIETLDNE